jgi:hypothetical protein
MATIAYQTRLAPEIATKVARLSSRNNAERWAASLTFSAVDRRLTANEAACVSRLVEGGAQR